MNNGHREREPLTTADVTTANVSTADVSTADVLVLGYDLWVRIWVMVGVRVWVRPKGLGYELWYGSGLWIRVRG